MIPCNHAVRFLLHKSSIHCIQKSVADLAGIPNYATCVSIVKRFGILCTSGIFSRRAETRGGICKYGHRYLHFGAPIYASLWSPNQDFGSQSSRLTLDRVSEPGQELSNKEITDFKDVLHNLVTNAIEDEDDQDVDGDDDLFVSQSGRVLMFPWRRWDGDGELQLDGVAQKVKHPSVTTILQKTMSAENAMALLRWENFMIKKMGYAAFQELKQEMFSEGKQLHTNIGHVLTNQPEEVDVQEGIKGYWESLKHRLPELVSDDQAPVLECHVTHPYLGYHGYADCVTLYKGDLCVVEFKTSRKPKETLSKCFDNPLQLAAYLGALNFDPHYQFKIEKALLVIAYKDGSPATFHLMDTAICDVYWKKWLRRLQEYREIVRRNGAKERRR